MSKPASQQSIQSLLSALRDHLGSLQDSAPSGEIDPHLEQAVLALDSLSEQIAAYEGQMEHKLQETTLDRARFISVMTHELRVPMTSIKGYASLISQGVAGPVTEQQVSFLGVIHNNVDRMAALVSDLSDIARIESGRLKLDISAVSFEAVVDKVMGDLQPSLHEKRLSAPTKIQPGLPSIAADASRLSQVLNSLIRNAIMYTPPGGEICVAASFNDRMITVEITDNGIGVKTEEQDRLFTPFFRSDDPFVREQNGWGLSLYVSSRLVYSMGGDIGMRSATGEGSTFWFSLPSAPD